MSKTDPMWVFENYATAAELIDELENSLAQRDAEVERLKAAPCECGASVGYVSGEKYEAAQQRIRDYRKRIAALESQQAASVGGEREAVEVVGWLGGNGIHAEEKMASGAPFPLMTVAQHERIVAALSPAGGGVDQAQDGSAAQKSFWAGFEAATLRLCGTDIRKAWNNYKASGEFARLNAKPQANSQEGE